MTSFVPAEKKNIPLTLWHVDDVIRRFLLPFGQLFSATTTLNTVCCCMSRRTLNTVCCYMGRRRQNRNVWSYIPWFIIGTPNSCTHARNNRHCVFIIIDGWIIGVNRANVVLVSIMIFGIDVFLKDCVPWDHNIVVFVQCWRLWVANSFIQVARTFFIPIRVWKSVFQPLFCELSGIVKTDHQLILQIFGERNEQLYVGTRKWCAA